MSSNNFGAARRNDRDGGVFAAPVFDVAATVITSDSIKIGWSPGSSLTTSYYVYGRRTINSRDLPTGSYVLLQNSTATTCQVNNLASGSFYTFSVHAVTSAWVDGNQAVFTFQTTALSGQEGTLAPGGTCPPCCCMHGPLCVDWVLTRRTLVLPCITPRPVRKCGLLFPVQWSACKRGSLLASLRPLWS